MKSMQFIFTILVIFAAFLPVNGGPLVAFGVWVTSKVVGGVVTVIPGLTPVGLGIMAAGSLAAPLIAAAPTP
uniref:Uncharacterized protein n=1 Tax=Panagrolaimus sp. ES5 TaxID=591445 RepID=A0AC34GG56_9BILA